MNNFVQKKKIFVIFIIFLFGSLIISGLVYQKDFDNPVGKAYIEKIEDNPIISNAVYGIYGMYRFYDTILELLIFSTAVLGISIFSDLEVPEDRKSNVLVESHVVNASASFLYPIIALFGIFLSYSAHQGPGGGFAGGVISGTGVLLLAVAAGAEEIGKKKKKKTMKKVEFAILLGIILSAILGFLFPAKIYEGLSGAVNISLVNISIGMKVFIGSWAILHFFVKHRGGV